MSPSVLKALDVSVLGEVDGLQEGLDHVGCSAGEFGSYVAADRQGKMRL